MEEATADTGVPASAMITSEERPEAISIFTWVNGVAEATSSAPLPHTQGFLNLDISEEKEKNTKTLPAMAGLAQLHPSPPKVHFTIAIAKMDAIRGMKRGTSGGIFMPTSRPVTRAE